MRKINYLEENWDYLLVLDACRFDVFSEVIADKLWKGGLEKVNSQANHTQAWYRTHWAEPNDVHLITANPHPYLDGSGPAFKNFKSDTRAWREGQIDPRITLKFFKERKKKGERYRIHLIPPHLPFLGKTGKKLFKKLGLRSITSPDVYEKIRQYGKEGNWDELKECYRENLSLVLDAIREHADLLSDGRTVLTADHGELLGEWGIYGHPPRPKSLRLRRILRTVPWFEVGR